MLAVSADQETARCLCVTARYLDAHLPSGLAAFVALDLVAGVNRSGLFHEDHCGSVEQGEKNGIHMTEE